jgi:sulfate adenylyltransferase subunit 2
MNARVDLGRLLPHIDHSHLDWLEEEAIFILREVAATFERPALLFSGGKDSCVVSAAGREGVQAQRGNGRFSGKLPFPLLHVDTGHNFPEVIQFRDQRVAEMGERLVVGHLEDSIRRGTVRLAHELESRNGHQSVTLLEAIDEHRLRLPDRGARARRRESARQGAHLQPPRRLRPVASPRSSVRSCGRLFNTRIRPGEHFRAFPDQQLDRARRVALHRAREHPAAGAMYYTHEREVVRRRGPAGARDAGHAAASRRTE